MKGALRRLLFARVADFLNGIGYPDGECPAAFAGLSSGARPTFTEADAANVNPWPGRTAAYDPEGHLKDPARASLGQFFATALSLGFAEVRAWLLGLTQDQDPGPELATHYFRFSRAISSVLVELLPTNLSQQRYIDAIRRLFDGTLDNQLDGKQPSSADLSALSGLTGSGLITRIATAVYAVRSIVQPAAGITVTNADGAAGNPTLALANDLAALEALASTGLAVRTATDAWAQRSLVQPAAGLTITNASGAAGNPTFALANDLAALEALASTGLAVRTGTDAWAQRSLTQPAAGLTITNADGSAGNPTFALANDLAALEALASTGLAVRTGADAWAQRSLTQPAAGLTIGNADGASGNPTFALANDLAALEALASTGLAVRTGADAWTQRTITGDSEAVVTNGNGVAGNPTLSIGATLTQKLLTSSGAASSVYQLVEIPAGSYKLRVYYRGDTGFLWTINASTADATTFSKDTTGATSTVMQLTMVSGFVNWKVMYESNSGNASWSTPTRSVRWNGAGVAFQISTGTAKQTAWSGGFVKGATSGDVLRFPVQWPIPFEVAPTNISFGTNSSNRVNLGSLTLATADVNGGEVNITVNANGDAYWIGLVQAGT